MAKYAVIISGQPRGVLETYQSIQESIIKPNNADVFLHSWIDKEMFGKPYVANWLKNQDKPSVASNHVPKDIDKIILDVYQPKKYLFESPKTFKYNHAIETKQKQYIPTQDIFSMLYSIRMAAEMKQAYEIENKIVYDVVIRIRFGMKFNRPSIIDLSNFYTTGVIFAPAGFDGFQNNRCFLNNISFCDHWNISNSHLINRLSETYFNIENLILQHGCFIQAEDLLGCWVRKVNAIPVALLDFQYEINCK